MIRITISPTEGSGLKEVVSLDLIETDLNNDVDGHQNYIGVIRNDQGSTDFFNAYIPLSSDVIDIAARGLSCYVRQTGPES